MSIYGILGGIGSGKTMTMVYLGLCDLYDGYKLYTNVKLKNIGAYRKNVYYLTTELLNDIFEKVKNKTIDMKNSTVMIQEAHNYIDSRTSNQKRNRAFSYFILQSRHFSRETGSIIYDTQRIGQVDKRLRENTDYIIRPTIIESFKIGKKLIPKKIKMDITFYKGQDVRRGVSVFDTGQVLNKYDTHELVMF